MFKNWRTTLLGALPTVALIVYKLSTHQPVAPEEIIAVLGLFGLGAVAKDSVVTGGKVLNSSANLPPNTDREMMKDQQNLK